MSKSYKIMSIEAKDLFSAMHQIGKDDCEYGIRGSDGQISLRKFTNTFDWSLDAIKLAEIYERKMRRRAAGINIGKKGL